MTLKELTSFLEKFDPETPVVVTSLRGVQPAHATEAESTAPDMAKTKVIVIHSAAQ
jgi:hypothetical protein